MFLQKYVSAVKTRPLFLSSHSSAAEPSSLSNSVSAFALYLLPLHVPVPPPGRPPPPPPLLRCKCLSSCPCLRSLTFHRRSSNFIIDCTEYTILRPLPPTLNLSPRPIHGCDPPTPPSPPPPPSPRPPPGADTSLWTIQTLSDYKQHILTQQDRS